MKRKIWLDDERFATFDVQQDDPDHDLWVLQSIKFDLKDVMKAMADNGFSVTGFCSIDSVLVDRTYFYFNGVCYRLKQCSDIFDWFGESKIGDFTYYYDRVVFHASEAFYAAYIEDTSNYTRV